MSLLKGRTRRATCCHAGKLKGLWTVHDLFLYHWFIVVFVYWLQMLVYSKFVLSQTLTSTVVRWAHCHKFTLGYCVTCLPWIHFEPDASIITRCICQVCHWWLLLEQGYGKRSGWGRGVRRGEEYHTVLELIYVLKSVTILLNISGSTTDLVCHNVNCAVPNCCTVCPFKVSVACFLFAIKAQKMQFAELNITPGPTTGSGM